MDENEQDITEYFSKNENLVEKELDIGKIGIFLHNTSKFNKKLSQELVKYNLNNLKYKIEKESDIEKIGKFLNIISYIDTDVGQNLIQSDKIKIKMEIESDVEKIGSFFRNISNIDKEIGRELLESLELNILKHKIEKEPNIEKIRISKDNFSLFSNEIGDELANSKLFLKLSSKQLHNIKLINQHISALIRNWKSEIYYTNHYMRHAENLIIILNSLVSEDAIKKFNSMEVFILYCSIYLHDIGLLSVKEEEMNTERIRSEHHLLSQNYIKNNYLSMALSPMEAELIAYICEAHNINDINSVKKYSDMGPYPIRVRFLASLLRLLDELDIDYSRTSTSLLFIKDPSPQLNEILRINRAVSNIEFEVETIILHVVPTIDNNPNSLLILIKKHANRIADLHYGMWDELNQNGVIYREVEVMIDSHVEYQRLINKKEGD